jgi:hypothetical protein
MTDERDYRDPSLDAVGSDAAMTSDAYVDDTDSDPEAEAVVIEEQIIETRSEMVDTIDAIGEKLQPANIVQQAGQTVRDATVGKVEDMVHSASQMVSGGPGGQQGIVDTIKQNPIPALMVGAGLAWLMRSRSSSMGGSGSRYQASYMGGGYQGGYDRRGGDVDYRYMGERGYNGQYGAGSSTGSGIAGTASSAVSGVTEKAGEAADTVRETASGAVDTVRDVASEVPYRAQDVVRTTGDRVNQIMQESPLALGAIALAVGAGAGLLLPTTRKEQEILGETRDRMVEKAETVVNQQLDKVEETATSQS